MRAALPGLTAVSLLLAACQVALPPIEPAGRPKAEAPAKAEPTKGPATPGPKATPPAPAATPTPGPLAETLRRPAGDVAVLAGTVAMDARYAVDRGQGRIVAAGGLNLVAVGGGNVMSHNGGAIVAAGGGNIIADKGSGIVAAGAGNLVPVGSGNWRLLQAAATPAPVEVGTVLPAAGMLVRVIDLRTGKPLAIGADAGGKAVYGVYTDGAGAFELFVPAAHQATVRVEARVPGTDDPRLAYEVLSAAGAARAPIDEDTALVSRYLAESWRGRMTSLMVELAKEPPATDEAVIKKLYGNAGTASFQAMIAVLKPLLTELRAAMKANGLKDAQAIAAASARAADSVLGHFDMGSLKTKALPAYKPHVTGEELAAEVFVAAVRQVRDAADARMREAEKAGAPAAFLASKPFATAGDRIRRPADVPAYIVAEALTDETDIQRGVAIPYLVALGMSQADALALLYRMWAANAAVGEQLALLLATDEGVKADLLAALK